MAPAEVPAETGRHGLGPHVVGMRVVVRRIVHGETGPTGGPAFTDVLGVCESWADGVALIRLASGTAVAIAIADIVSGKPVPPRPSIRQRVGVREAEGHGLVLWPDVEAEEIGAWVLRYRADRAEQVVKRANSCLATGEPGIPAEAATARIIEFYRERSRTPLAQVTVGGQVEEQLLAAGWTPVADGDAHFQLTSVSAALRALPDDLPEAEIVEDGARATASIGEHASGRAALDRDWLGLHELAVDPGHRGRGLGNAVLATLLEWGAMQGAQTAWLQVETENAEAIAWYDGLGFRTHHTTRYLTI